MLKKYWWIIAIVVVVVVYALYRGMQGGAGAKASPTDTSVVPTVQTSSVPAPSSNIYTTRTDPTKGDYLADFQGMSLYTYDKDTTGVSNCTGTCLAIWPAYTSGASAEAQLPENITVITRADGTMQFAWKGMPLYYFSKDASPGDILGDGVGSFHLVKP